MNRTGAIALFLLLATTELGAQTHKQAQNVVSPLEQAMKSLAGRVLFACSPPSPAIKRFRSWPVFYLTTPDGKLTADRMDPPFSFGTRLTIIRAQSDFTLDSNQLVKVKLDLLDQANSQRASVEVVVASSDFRPARILRAVSSDYFSTHKIPESEFVGMTEDDLYCLDGYPDHVNTDAIGPDQLIYDNGSRYIYIGNNGRIEDIQESY